MKVRNKTSLFIGVGIIIILCVSYFIKIEIEVGDNFVTYDRLLGILIFHNVFLLVTYILVAIVLLYFGLRIKVKLIREQR